jgi:hypothetical protein
MFNGRVMLDLYVYKPNETTGNDAFSYLPRLRAIEANYSGLPTLQRTLSERQIGNDIFTPLEKSD